MASKEPDKPSTSESEKSQAPPLIASVPTVTPERHPLQNNEDMLIEELVKPLTESVT